MKNWSSKLGPELFRPFKFKENLMTDENDNDTDSSKDENDDTVDQLAERVAERLMRENVV